MNSRFYSLIMTLILGSIVMGACTVPPTLTATPAPKPTATASPAPTATLTPKPTATAPGGFPVGTFKPDHLLWAHSIVFYADGTFVIVLGTGDDGHYVVNGDQIVFNMDYGICHIHPGTYHWELHGNTLTLKPINETCTETPRSEDLGGRCMDSATVRTSICSPRCPANRSQLPYRKVHKVWYAIPMFPGVSSIRLMEQTLHSTTLAILLLIHVQRGEVTSTT